MPSLILHSMRNSLPDAKGFPSSRLFKDMPRFTSFDCKTSRTALPSADFFMRGMGLGEILVFF
jgi:hypothetical protein